MPFTLTSTAFQEGEIIPSKHTCSGQDVSPPLQWSAPPKGTRSFALIMDDPDAPVGTWVHKSSAGYPVSLLRGGMRKCNQIIHLKDAPQLAGGSFTVRSVKVPKQVHVDGDVG